MKRLIILAAFALVSVPVQAHFVWLVPSIDKDGSSTIHVRFGEDADDDGTEYLSRLKGIVLHQVSGKRDASVLKVESSDSGITSTTKFDDQTVVVTSHDLGVLDRGDSKFRLQYYSKAGPSVQSPAWRKARSADDLRLDVVPFLKNGKLRLKVLFDEELVAGVEVKAARPGMDDFEGQTNANGMVIIPFTEGGVHSVRARHVEKVAGEIDGKSYPETRHYCTVAIDLPAADSTAAAAAISLQDLPRPVTSFGAAVVGKSLYMYGGHTGGAHSYSKQEQSNELTKLDLKTGQWSSVISGPHLQGLALVTHGGKLYRIGGFTAENAEGEDHKLVSQNSVAAFDPSANSWTELPALPECRSSHDAAVVGDELFVVGGWCMSDDQETEWHSTAWKMDVTANKLEWTPIADPGFKRRAVALAAHDNKLYVVGGMQDEGGPTTAVAVYDPRSDKWSEGPSLFVKPAPEVKEGEKPQRSMSGGKMAGFGASAFDTGGSLYVTTVQGNLQRLSADGSKWEVVKDNITPRFFHRLLPYSKQKLIVVGGSNMSIGKFEEVEVIKVGAGS